MALVMGGVVDQRRDRTVGVRGLGDRPAERFDVAKIAFEKQRRRIALGLDRGDQLPARRRPSTAWIRATTSLPNESTSSLLALTITS
jgi:hypothetical protein